MGIAKNGLIINSPLEFTVDTREAGLAHLGVTVTDVDQLPLEVTVKDNKDGTFLCKYTPRRSVKHVVCVTYGGVVIPNFPVRVRRRNLVVFRSFCSVQ
jgi:filamin